MTPVCYKRIKSLIICWQNEERFSFNQLKDYVNLSKIDVIKIYQKNIN